MDITEKVRDSLFSFGIKPSSVIGIAVSGGADSICLLTVIHSLTKENQTLKNLTLKAVTIDHNMRPKEESSSDADFVETYCKKLELPCFRYTIPVGKIEEVSKEKNCGSEAAARNLRYSCFEDFIKKEKIDFLCLAHNANDQTETLVMRFLQGGSVHSLSGIPLVRDSFVRPLLSVSRKEIEAYLSEKKISYRTDSTNSDNAMLRNRIRHELLPLLDKNFPGYEKSLLAMSRKMSDDSSFILSCTDEAKKEIFFKAENNFASFSLESFRKLHKTLRIRILYDAFDEALHQEKSECRVPYDFLLSLDKGISKEEKISQEIFNFICEEKEGFFVIRKKEEDKKESGYFLTVKSEGDYSFDEFTLSVEKKDDGIGLSAKGKTLFLSGLSFPFVLRSLQNADTIEDAKGTYRSVSKILEGWKCGEKKYLVPLVQELKNPSLPLRAVWGEVFGTRNWIVNKGGE